MTILLLSVVLTTPPPSGDWKFVDAASRDGRLVVSFRTVELAGAPTRPLDPADKPPPGSRFGSAGVGPGGRHRLGLVWHAGTHTLWLDADGDGRFAAAERHTLGDKPVEITVAVPFGDGVKHDRTVMIRKRAEGVAWAVRGYTSGNVSINGEKMAALLTDGDADGCFDGAGADRVWLDLDGDGKFDALTEQFPLGTAIAAGNTALLVRPRPDGLGVQIRERPSETGMLRVVVVRQPKAEVVELSANYVSEFGELIVVKAADQPMALPGGKYRVDSVRLKLLDADGKVWHYTLASGDRTFGIEVTRGRTAVHQLLDGLKVTVTFDAPAGVPSGESVQVQPNVAAGGLYMTRCEVGEKFADYGREVFAEIQLTESGSVTLDRCESGFH